jgi:ribosomal protein S6--L-glutamate ligase
LTEELQHRGVEVDFAEPELRILDPQFQTQTCERAPDLVLNRLLGDERGLEHVLEWCEWFERSLPPTTIVINRTSSVRIALSKRLQAVTYSTHGLPTPKTILVSRASEIDEVIAAVGLPLVVKPDIGFGGEGVIRCLRKSEVETAVANVADGIGIAQAYVEEAFRTLRLLVACDSVLASIARIAVAGDWRANVAQGASVQPHDSSDAEIHLALTAAAAVGLDVAGVDIVNVAGEPMLLEINPSPGLAGVEAGLQRNVASEIVETLIATYRDTCLAS